ncbi:MAG: SCP2 sterol-binding domain-containing protein [Candidatus Hodarchaeales archaeon]|jgi:putative sterol carrier protein
MLLGSKKHLLEIQKRVNEDEEYLEMTKGEGRKSFTFILEPEPKKNVTETIRIGYEENDGYIEEIWEGEKDTGFIITGKYGNWVRILRQELGATKALTMRKLKLKKGSLLKLLRSSDSTIKWIQILASIPVEFHGDYVNLSTAKE